VKVTIDRAELTAVTEWAAQALPSRTPTPILAGIRLAADDGTLTASAFDYDAAATAVCGVEEPGEVVVPRPPARVDDRQPARRASLGLVTGGRCRGRRRRCARWG
jgi:hypothetical protein